VSSRAHVLLLVALAACSARTDGRTGSLHDDFGAPVADGRAHPVHRIVSLNPSTTEMLFTIGAGNRVVGRTQYDLWPPAALAVPSVGPGLRPNVEAVLARHPDLVVLYASNDNRAAYESLRRAGVAVLALKNDRIADIARVARMLGRVLDDSANAERMADTVLETLDSVRAATASLTHPTVFWHVWDSPPITIGRGSYLDELVEIAGARNVYHDLPAVSPAISLEDLIRRNPDYVLAGPDGAATIRASAAWHVVGAVARRNVIVVDTGLVGRPSVRLGEAAWSLARLLHPGQLP